MPKLEIDQNDDGTFGALPEPLQKFVNKLVNEGKDAGHRAAEKKLQGEIDTLRQQAGGSQVAAEKLKAAERELSEMREAQALRDQNWEAAQKERDERHAKELAERDAAAKKATGELERRDTRIRELVKKEIGLAAARAGALASAVPQIEDLLDRHIGLDEGFQPFVRDEKDPGKPRLDKDGKAVSVEGFVTEYLAKNLHFKAASNGRGGGATGGRTQSQAAGAKTGHEGLDAVRASRAQADERFDSLAKSLSGAH